MIEAVWRRGARLDAWSEHFQPHLWWYALAEAGSTWSLSCIAIARRKHRSPGTTSASATAEGTWSRSAGRHRFGT